MKLPDKIVMASSNAGKIKEIRKLLAPLKVTVVQQSDYGVSDADEKANGTDPNNPDTDGDGVLDGDELDEGTDPTNASDFRDPASGGLNNTPGFEGYIAFIAVALMSIITTRRKKQGLELEE